MDETLRALGNLLLSSVPTFILVVLLYFYLKFVFFRPLDRVLAARYAATEGARQAAEGSARRAAEKTAEYEAAVREARARLYREQEGSRRRLREDLEAAVRGAKESAESMVRESTARLAVEAEQARARLGTESEYLADQITNSILTRRPS